MIRSFNSLALAALALAPLLVGARTFVESSAIQPSSTAAALAPDAIVLESGELETRAEYIAHHLGADIEFARAVPSKRTIVETRRDGNVVWVVATSISKGRFGDRQIDSRGAELMVLSKSGAGWLIRTIHWSSRRAPQS